jgi:hypothetical protein
LEFCKIIALKKKPKAAKCSDHRTLIRVTHTEKLVARRLRRRIERKIEMYLEKIIMDLEEEEELEMQLGC